MPAVPAAPDAPPDAEKPAAASPFGGEEFATQGEEDFRNGKYAEAIHAWKHALVDDPTNGAYVLLLAQALFQTGKFEEAAGATQQAAQMLPADKWGVVSGNYRQLYSNIQDYTDKLRVLEKARDEKPNEPAFHFLLGWHYGYLGYPKQAIPELNKAIELAPKDEIAIKVRDAMAAKLEKPKSELSTPAPSLNAPTTP
jgi:tetratricopeptide (TPR) repeat protein